MRSIIVRYRYDRIIGMLFVTSIPMMPLVTKSLHIALGAVALLVWLSRALRKPFSLNSFETMYLLFIGLSLFSMLYAESPWESLRMIREMVFSIVLLLGALRLIILSYGDIDVAVHKALSCFMISTVLVSAACLLYERALLGSQSRLGSIIFADNGNFFINYGTYMVYSYNITISFFYVIYRLMEPNKKRSTTIMFIFFLLFLLICSVFSGTRKLMMLPFVFLLVYLLYQKRAEKAIVAIPVVFLLLGIAYNIVINVPWMYEQLGFRIERMVASVLGGGDARDGSIIERSAMISIALDLFLSKPLLGNGLASFAQHYGRLAGRYIYSHNNYVELLSGLGIVGFSLYYSWFFLTIRSLVRNRQGHSRYSSFFAAALMTIVVFDYGTVSYMRIHFLFLLELAAFYCRHVNARLHRSMNQR